MGFTPELIGSILTGIGLFFIIVGVLWGLIRGLKKTAFRGVWLLVTAVILLFLTPVIAKSLYTMDLSFTNLHIAGEKLTSLNQLINTLIANNQTVADFVAANPSLLGLLPALAFSIVNVILFVVLFWFTKIVLWPIWAIFAKIFFKKKDKDGNPKKRRRGLGALVGAFIGLMIGAITMLPVLGVMNTATSIEKESGRYNNGVGVVAEFGSSTAVNFLNSYDNSILKYIYKFTGTDFLASQTFNQLTTVKYNNQKFNIKDELSIVATTAVDIKNIQFGSISNLSQDEISDLIATAKRLNQTLLNSKVLSSVADELLPYTIDQLVNNPDFIVQIPSSGQASVDDAIIEVLLELKNFNVETIKNDINSILDCIAILNDEGIILKLIHNTATTFDEVLALFDDDLIERLNDTIFTMRSASSLLPISLNLAFNYAAKYLEIEGFSNSTPAQTNIQQTFETLFKTTIALLNTIDTDSSYYFTNTTLPYMGRLIDTIKSYDGLTNESYDQLINAIQDKLGDMLEEKFLESSNLSESFKTAITDSIKRIVSVPSYEIEFEKYVVLFEDIESFINSIESIDDIDFSKTGKLLDSLKDTYIFGESIDDFVAGTIDMFVDMFDDEDTTLSGFKTIISNISNNITSDLSYEDEFATFSSFFDILKDITASTDLSADLLSDSNPLFADIGKALDSLKESKLIGNQIPELIVEIFTIAKKDLSFSDQDLTTSINSVFDSIIANIRAAEDISWEIEFTHLKSLIKITDELEGEINYIQIGRTLDSIVATSEILDNTVINNLVSIFINQTIDNLGNGVFVGKYENIPASLKAAVSSITSYEDEFKALDNLKNITSLISGDKYSDIGALIDESYSTSALTRSMANTLIDSLYEEFDFDAYDESLTSTFNSILSSLKTKTSTGAITFETAFEELETLKTRIEVLDNIDIESPETDTTYSDILNAMQQMAIVGIENTKIIAEYIFNEIKDNVSDLNVTPTFETAKSEVLSQINTILNDINNSEGTINYATIIDDLFSNIALLQ